MYIRIGLHYVDRERYAIIDSSGVESGKPGFGLTRARERLISRARVNWSLG